MVELFSREDYLVITFLGIFSTFSIVSRTLAYKYEMISKVSIIGYLAVPITLVIDVFMFDARFN